MVKNGKRLKKKLGQIFRKWKSSLLYKLHRNFVSPFSGHITCGVGPLTLTLPSPLSQHVCSHCSPVTDRRKIFKPAVTFVSFFIFKLVIYYPFLKLVF